MLWSRELDELRARLVDLLHAGDGLAALLEDPEPLLVRERIQRWDDAARAAGVAAEHGYQRTVRP